MAAIDPKYTDPKLWGPPFWHIMRTVAHNYPTEPKQIDKQHVKVFFINIQHMLPCQKCRTHYSSLLVKFPIDKVLCCNSCLIKWVENIHTEISKNK